MKKYIPKWWKKLRFEDDIKHKPEEVKYWTNWVNNEFNKLHKKYNEFDEIELKMFVLKNPDNFYNPKKKRIDFDKAYQFWQIVSKVGRIIKKK